MPEGVHPLGGGAGDAVRLERLPPGLLTLRIEGHRLMVEATRTFTVGSVMVPPGVPRLVLPGQQPQWLSDAAPNVNGTTIPLSWNQPLNWIGGVPDATGAA